MPMPEASRCAECGAALPLNWPKGLCSACALRGSLESTPSINHEPDVIPPSANVADQPGLDAPVNGLSLDQMFDIRWAQTIMERALGRLGEEYAASGKAALFNELKDIQLGEHGT